MKLKLKIIDGFLVRSFLPPFAVTFVIALFVFVMQTLWLYIDEIAGKGVGFFLMVELVAYMSVSMIPMALPVAVLISSVMVLGNLAERYELSSIKSAGVSLWRVMKPLMLVTLLIAAFSFFCSNYFIPVSNLKFKSRLYDIRRQKPTLSLEESAFNDDFQGYSIRIGDKLPDNQTIREVVLFDDAVANEGRLQMLSADSGRMYGSNDGKYFVMQLYGGEQYIEPKPQSKGSQRNYPFMRARFEEFTKVFNLDEFELDRTDENLFKAHHAMLSNRQLAVAIDSIDEDLQMRIFRNAGQVTRQFYFFEKDLAERLRKARFEENRNRDFLRTIDTVSNPADTTLEQKVEQQEEAKSPPTPWAGRPASVPQPAAPYKPHRPDSTTATADTAVFDPARYSSFAETLPEALRGDYTQKALLAVRNITDQAANLQSNRQRILEGRVKYVHEFHSKFSFSLACFIFLFVGAPMGAIVRKGGFGWPLLISIIFFMLFIVISIFSKNIAERFVIDAVLAAWLNCLIIFPMGLIFTFWAMRDRSLQQVAEGLFRR